VFSSTTGHYLFDPNLTAAVSLVRVTHPRFVDIERQVEVKPYAWVDFALQPK
jgi:hypothetical protein